MNTTTYNWRTIMRPAIVSLILFTLVLGVAYPLAITGVAQLVLPWQANGSLIRSDSGAIIGSALIGQQFTDPAYFWGRPSATGPVPYNAAASSGSNYGPLNPALIDAEGAIQTRIDALQQANVDAGVTAVGPIPVDLVTSSASGLDPQISPAAAQWQMARVAAVRGLDAATVQSLVDANTETRTFGFLGEPRVNVLELNLALDALE